jgi:hypothetical protein
MAHSLITTRKNLSLGLILISLCWTFPLLAQQVQNKTSELGEDQVEAIVERLGDEDFKVRNKAYATLGRMLEKDEKIDAHLQKFKNHEDPEISTRISGLLKQHEKQLKLKNELFEFQKQIAKLRLLEKQADGVWRIDPDDEKMMRSIDKKKSIHKIKLTFVNQSKQPVKIFTICAHKHKDEGGGNRNKHAKIEPGKTHNCKETWEKRVYVLTDMDDKALGLYLTGEKNAKIEFKGVPAAKK